MACQVRALVGLAIVYMRWKPVKMSLLKGDLSERGKNRIYISKGLNENGGQLDFYFVMPLTVTSVRCQFLLIIEIDL